MLQPRFADLATYATGSHRSYCATVPLFSEVTAQPFYCRTQARMETLPNLLLLFPLCFFLESWTQEGTCPHATIIVRGEHCMSSIFLSGCHTKRWNI